MTYYREREEFRKHIRAQVCPATGDDHAWTDDLTEAQILTGLRPRHGWTVRCEECGESFTAQREAP